MSDKCMDRKGSAFIIVLIVAIIVLVAGTGIWYYETRPSTSDLNTSDVEATPAASSTPSDVTSTDNIVPAAIATTTPAQPITPASQQIGPITAASTGEIANNQTFTLTEYPDVSFALGNIYFGTGGVLNSYCNSLYQGGGSYIFIQDQPPGSSPSGTCIDASQQIDGQDMRVVVFTLTINDNGSSDIYDTFVRAMYQMPDGATNTLYRVAQPNPNWGGYGTSAYTSHNIVLGFEMPVGVNKLNLYYGNYPPAGEPTTQANFADEGGYIINFSLDSIQKTID